MTSLTRFVLRHRLAVAVCWLVVTLAGIYRIVDTPMQSPGGAGKNGTSLIRVIAYRNYVIEFISEKLVDGL